MRVSLRKKGLDSLFKQVRVSKVWWAQKLQITHIAFGPSLAFPVSCYRAENPKKIKIGQKEGSRPSRELGVK